MSRPPSDARDRALGAAIVIASRDGVGSLTIEAVAREAELSKGGVLHHFKTKDALVLAMVERLCDMFEAGVLAAAEADPDPVGRQTRAFLAALAPEELTTVSRALLAAVAHDPKLLEPLRRAYTRCYARVENDGIDPVDAHIVRLAADAMWMSDVFDLPPIDREMQKQVMDRLRDMTHPEKKR
jgi:AcrR family transcriptional regulator